MNKYTIIAALVALGAGAAYFFGYKKGDGSDGSKGTEDVPSDAEKDIVKKDLTFQESWYSQTTDMFINNLQRGWRWKLYGDTDAYNALKDVLLTLGKLKTRSDWNMLVSKFDVRSTVSASAFFNPVNILISQPLTTWLRYFLEDKTYKTVSGVKVTFFTMAKELVKKLGVIL